MSPVKAFKIARCAAAVLCLALLAGCGAPAGEGRPAKPVVAVTIVPEGAFVEAVCGDLAEVVVLVPPGNSPENYEPTPALMEALGRASLYFSIGVPVEEAHILPDAGDIPVVSLREEAAAAYPELTFENGERDPHIWLSPKRVKVMIGAIAREMSALDPENAPAYEANAQAYAEALDAADEAVRQALEGVQNRKFVVYHPAFGYFAADYGLEMFALEEEGKEATPRHLQEMIDLAKAEDIRVVFYQEEIDSRQSEAYAEEIGGRAMQLSPLAADYIGNLKAMAAVMAEAME